MLEKRENNGKLDHQACHYFGAEIPRFSYNMLAFGILKC